MLTWDDIATLIDKLTPEQRKQIVITDCYYTGEHFGFTEIDMMEHPVLLQGGDDVNEEDENE